MAQIIQDKYILGQSATKSIVSVGQEIRLDLSLNPNTNDLKGGKVTGKVLNINGQGVPNALVKLMSTSYEPLMHTMTDENGNYSLVNVSSGSYNIFAIASGMKLKQGNQFSVTELQNVTIDLTVEEDPSMKLAIIAGDLINSTTNGAVGGAVVSLFLKAADGTETLEAVTYTNEYGQYVFREVPKGEYAVRISALGYTSVGATASVTTDGQIVSMNVSITANANTSKGTVSGVITNNLNEPVNRADVILYKVNANSSLTPVAFTKTNSNGVYLFTNVGNGNYKVKSNQLELVDVSVPDTWTYAPSFAGFNLYYTNNYMINKYRAQDGTLGDGASINETTGFVQGLNVGFVTLNINVPRAGAYYLAVRYLASDHKILSVSINGANPANVLCYKTATTNVADARIRYISVSLKAGDNTVKFYNKFQLPPPDIDTVDVSILPYASTQNIAAGTLENGASANENGFILGLGGPDNGAVTFTVTVPVDGTYVFGIRYVNNSGATRPMKISVDGGNPITGNFNTTPNGLAEDAIEAVMPFGNLTAGQHTVKFYNDTGDPSIIPGPSQARLSVPMINTLAKDGTLENGAEVLASGYVYKIGGENQGAVTINVNASEAGKYSVGVQYVNASGIIGDMKVSVNGGEGAKNIFPKTATNLIEDAQMYYMVVNLVQGNNTIKLYNDEAVTVQSPVINEITVQRVYIYKEYGVTDANITLSNGAQVQNGLITNVGYGLGQILLTYTGLPFYGPYYLEMMYVTTDANKKCNIDVNGVSTNETYTFEPTASENVSDVRLKKVDLDFKVGTNTVKIYTA